MSDRKKFIQAAADARSDLNIFYAVIALMESSLVTSRHFPAEARIVRICKTEAQKALRAFDDAVTKATKP